MAENLSVRPSLIIAFVVCATSWGDPVLEVQSQWKKVRGATLPERIDSASRSLLGVPFGEAPLGEGPGAEFDEGPRSRFDFFDCTTYVETVLALAFSRLPKDFEEELGRLRYQNGKVSFETRNHFPCVDWTKNNTQSGRLTDITESVGANWKVARATAPISKKGWYAALPESAVRLETASPEVRALKLKELRARGAMFADESPSLPYVTLDSVITRTEVAKHEKQRREDEEKEIALKMKSSAERSPQSDTLEKEVHDALIDRRLRYLIDDTSVSEPFLKSLPHATLLNVVRPGWRIPGTQMNISHQGFVIQKKEGTYLRHVSKSGGRAKDVPLANYLRLCLLIPSIKGINFQRVNGHSAPPALSP
jgi:hypothetical protein